MVWVVAVGSVLTLAQDPSGDDEAAVRALLANPKNRDPYYWAGFAVFGR